MYIGKIETGKSYKKLLVFFVLASLLLIAFVIYASFSRAAINLVPQDDTLTSSFNAMIAPDNINDSEQLGVTITGRVLTTEVKSTYTVNNVETIGLDEKATGTITIYNKRDKDQPLLPNSQLMSENNVLFRTDERIVAKAGEEVTVDITADQPGKTGNLDPQRFNIIKLFPDWQKKIYGETKTATTGGYREAKVVTEKEMARGEEEALDQAATDAIKELSKDLKSGEAIFEVEAQKELISKEFSVPKDTEADTFDVTVKAKITVITYDEETLKEYAKNNLEASIPADQELVQIQDDSFTYKITDYDLVAGTAKVEATLTADVIAKLSNQLFEKEKLKGLNEMEIKQYYEEYKDIKDIEVSFSPFWVKTVPTLEDHIDIKVK
ncbi:MAG: baseplate J/gp47 family protein [bacterium]